MDNIFCIECGFELPSTAKFCLSCGEKIPEIVISDPEITKEEEVEEETSSALADIFPHIKDELNILGSK